MADQSKSPQAMSVAGSQRSLARGPHKRSMEDLTSTLTYAQNLQLDLEASNLAKISAMLKGKTQLQGLVMLQLEKGTLEAKLAGAGGKRQTTAASSNKFNLLSCENCEDILSAVCPITFAKEVIVCLKKAQLVELVSFVGLVEMASAIPSRKLAVIGAFVKARSADLVKDRFRSVVFTFDSKGKASGVDWNKCGVYSVEETRNEAGVVIARVLHHRLSAQLVRLTEEFLRQDIDIRKNYSETEAYIELQYSQPKVKAIFAKAGLDLPKPFYIERIPASGISDDECMSEAASSNSFFTIKRPRSSHGVGLSEVALAAHEANAQMFLPPQGDGDSQLPGVEPPS